MDEITLFDINGKPVSYVQISDGTIFLFNGEPVSYIDEDENIYGFNGEHLGWFQDGIIWDHNGFQVGYIQDKSPVFTQFEPFKGFKMFLPFKSFKKFAPFQPFKSMQNSTVPLDLFLRAGRK